MANQNQTRRDRIVEEIRRRMRELKAGLPADDPYSVTWDIVTRTGLEGMHERKRYSLSLLDTDERKTPKIQQMDCVLTVILAFKVYLDKGEEAGVEANRVMGDVQRKMREDLHLTEPDDGRPRNERELSESVVEAANQLEIGGFADRQVEGAVIYNVTYKHAIQDPRELVAPL